MSAATLARSLARAAAPTQASAGMALRAPGTLLAGAPASPLASYQSWLSGAVTNASLPRPALDFLAAAFSPAEPITPFPIDVPPPGSNRPEPRRQDYPVAINLPHTPGYGKLVDFAQLRAYADLSSVARACIRMRVDEVLGLEWDIAPTKAAHEQLRGDTAALADFQARRDEAMRFWRRPDPNYFSFASWFKAAQEEKFVLDALSLYLHPTRLRGRGPFGSDLAALELLSGDTIYPLVDVSGASPRPPAPAYQQYVKGVPRVDLMAVIDEADQDRMDELGAPDAEFRGDQLLYLPYTRRAWTMYGFPPMEQAILPIITSVRRQEFRLQFFTEGTIPGLFITAPEDWTAKQIRQLQDALNAIGVGQEMRWRHIVLPGGSGIQPMKPNELATEADSTLAEDVMMAFDVKPMEMGTLPGGKATGMGSGDMMAGQAAAGRRHSLRPDTRWWEGVFTFILQDVFRQRDMRFAFLGLEDQEDEAAKAQVHVTYVNAGILSRDEVRLDLDKEPWGFDETKEPTITTGSGISPLDGAFEQQQQAQALQAQQTKAQIAAARQPKPGQPGASKPAAQAKGVDLAKFDPGEPREPAGQATGGEWTGEQHASAPPRRDFRSRRSQQATRAAQAQPYTTPPADGDLLTHANATLDAIEARSPDPAEQHVNRKSVTDRQLAERYQPWADALTTEEKGAFVAYQGPLYHNINGMLRFGTGPADEEGRVPDVSRDIAALDRALARPEAALAQPMVAYRGMAARAPDGRLWADHIGDVVQDAGYTSVSADPLTATGFLGSGARNSDGAGATLAVVRLPAGTHAGHLSHPDVVGSDGSELLLPHGTRFRVLGTTVRPQREATPLKLVALEVVP